MKRIILFIAFTTWFLPYINSQNIPGALNINEQKITIGTGIDYAILPLIVSYDRGINLFNFNAPMEIGADMTIPVFDFDLADSRLRLYLKTTLIEKQNFFLNFQFGPNLVNSSLQTQSMQTISADFILSPGIHAGNWSFSADLWYNHSISSYIKHTEKFKDLVYADVVDGWYYGTSSNIRVGATIVRSFKKIDISLSGGVSKTGQLKNYLFVPSMYTIFSVGYKF